MDKASFVGYYRVSSGRQAEEGNALERYRESLLDFGVPEDRLFYDVESGASETRKGFNKMIRLIKRGGVSGCVIPYQSRLARSVKIWAEFSELLLVYDVDLYDLSSGAKEPVDITSPTGEFINYVKAAQAQMMRTEVRQHAIAGHAKLREKCNIFRAPFGYRVSDEMKPVPDDSAYFDSGMTCHEVAIWLVEEYLESRNKAGTINKAKLKFGIHKVTKDRPCSVNGFTYWINHPILQGHTAYFYGTERETIIRNTHAKYAIVSPSTARLLKLNQRSRQGKAKSPHPLAGFIVCSECKGIVNKRKSRPITSRIKSKNLPWKDRPEFHYLACKNAAGYKPVRKQGVECAAKRWHPYNEVKLRIINEITKASKQIGLAAGTPSDPTQSNEARQLIDEIAKLEALEMPDLEPIIVGKRNRLDQLKNSADLADIETIKQAQAIAAKSGFWLTATDAELRELLSVIVDKVVLSPDGSVSAVLR